MNRLRRRSALVGLIMLAGILSSYRGHAQPSVKKGEDKPVEKVAEKPAEKWLLDRSLTVSPARAPIPALKYRFYPSSAERKDGNAVPIYLRFAQARNNAKNNLSQKPAEWNKLPLEKLPLAEVKPFLEEYRYNFRQLELGARRKTADWNYTLDAGNPIEILLPDVQEMRMHAPLLQLKARAEIAEDRLGDAIRTLETGFSFSQQVSEGPFLINSLVGIACARIMADGVIELIQRPDAPNCYWALTVLPRPLVEVRFAMEIEQRMPEMWFTDLAELGRPRSPEQWDAILGKVRKELNPIYKDMKWEKKPGTGPTDPASKSPDLPAARKYLTEVALIPAAEVEAMPPAQILLYYLTNFYHEWRDDIFKSAYLPFPEGWPLGQAAEERLKSSVPDTEAGRMVKALLPAVLKVYLAQVRLERELAALRAIEALRMHAAANGGDLPEKLDRVTIVPVPNDPGTGRPFEYKRDGQTATLISRIPGDGLRYQITMKK